MLYAIVAFVFLVIGLVAGFMAGLFVDLTSKYDLTRIPDEDKRDERTRRILTMQNPMTN